MSYGLQGLASWELSEARRRPASAPRPQIQSKTGQRRFSELVHRVPMYTRELMPWMVNPGPSLGFRFLRAFVILMMAVTPLLIMVVVSPPSAERIAEWRAAVDRLILPAVPRPTTAGPAVPTTNALGPATAAMAPAPAPAPAAQPAMAPVPDRRDRDRVRSQDRNRRESRKAATRNRKQARRGPSGINLTTRHIVAGVKRNVSSLGGCIDTARRRGEIVPGGHKFIVSWVIDTDRTVRRPEMVGPSYVMNTSLPRCFSRQMSDWRFARPTKPTPVNNFPIPVRVP